MIRWTCDNCGFEKTGTQIVGHEFDYSPEFSSLALELDGKRDLCARCMKVVNAAAQAARLQASASLSSACLQALQRMPKEESA